MAGTHMVMKGALSVVLMAAAASYAPNADALSRQDKRALVGAVVGGLAGSLVSNGDPWATAGGALAGGALGGATTPDKRDDRRHHERDWRRQHEQRRAWERRDAERIERERRARARDRWGGR